MEIDDDEAWDPSSTVKNNLKKRQRRDEVEEPEPAPKRSTRSSSRQSNIILSPNMAGVSERREESTANGGEEIGIRSVSSPALPVTDPGPIRLRLTSKVSLKLPTMKPTPMDQLKRQKPPTTENSTSWASLLDRKGVSPPKPKFSTASPQSGDDLASFPLKTAVSLNPYAPSPGDALHPFFMSSEARRTHAIKDNQQKLQSAVAKRQEEIRSQNKPGLGSISAFFQPRPKPAATTSATPINLELRSGFANFGSNLPEFPLMSHVQPSIPASSMALEESIHPLAWDDESLEEEMKNSDLDLSRLIPSYKRYHGLETSESAVNGVDSMETGVLRDQVPMDDETVYKIATSLEQSHLEIRRSLGMNTTVEVELKREKSAVEQVPLLDVKAEDMAMHLALQQQAVAQRQVAEEEALIAATFFNPPYTVTEVEDLYRVMAKQRETSPHLPWVSCYAPTKASHVCGNRHVAIQLKEWLIRWQTAVDVLESEMPKGSDFFKKRAPVKVVETPHPLESLANTVVLAGPTGCGKTAAVYAVANEMGFEVLEVNASIKRTGSSLRAMIEEATQSRHLGRASKTLTILLFEEVDQSFEEDAGFFNALVSICESAKRPIVLTCRELPRAIASRIPKLTLKEMKLPDEAAIFIHASLACFISGFSLPTPSLLHQFALWFHYDLRAILHHLQFWTPLLHQRNWTAGILALAGLPTPHPLSTLTHCFRNIPMELTIPQTATPTHGPISTEMASRIFLMSESSAIPSPLNLLHHHYLDPLLSKESKTLDHQNSNVDPLMMNGENTQILPSPSLMDCATRISDSLALMDAWNFESLQDDEFDTQHELLNEIGARMQLQAHLTIHDWSPCEKDESCYSLAQKTRQDATEALVSDVSNAMISRSGSRLSRFDDRVGLAHIATIENQQRLLNVKRRQYKSKIDWNRIKPAQRLLFIRAMRLSEVPSTSSSAHR